MDIIYTDRQLNEINYLDERVYIDLEIGTYLSDSKNDFEITIPADQWDSNLDKGSIVFENDINSEFGGRIQGKTSNTASNKIIFYGYTWRGLISKRYIKPAPGKAYYFARGDANEFLRNILDAEFDGLIVGASEDAGVEVNRDLRYVNMLEGIEKTLSDIGYRMKITMVVDQNSQGKISSRKFAVSAVPIIDHSDTKEYSNDAGYSLVAKDIENGYNHCICLGQGELTERKVVELFKLSNGMITQDEDLAVMDGIIGLNRRTMLYDYSSVESLDELINGGIDKLNENSDTKSLQISNVDNVEIGDIVGARDRITGIYMQKQIESKILSGYMNRIKIQYKVGD